jgi:Ni,Fe-hydrogenase III large subunit/NADH:ubiquinone oxidoreductase subunit C
MAEKKYIEIIENPGKVTAAKIPELTYTDFYEQTVSFLKKDTFHCLNYFVNREGSYLRFYILIANDASHKILVYTHKQQDDINSIKSITSECMQMHVFEREIHEITGIGFEGHPWLKPVRYPEDRFDKSKKISDYPFYKVEGEEIHEVGVGPIHAGVIEPGHFRFQCYGERVLHLEIQLGYQHRGAENLFLKKDNLLYRSVIAESIAGDTAIGHGIAFSQLAEMLSGNSFDNQLNYERIIALEMERIAVHIGDTAALCGDVAYQIGQVACEALRTIVINTTQDWCGNRFGKGLIRPGGTNYPLTRKTVAHISERLGEVQKRFTEITRMIYDNMGVLARFENTGQLSKKQALLAGAVGMAARSTGLIRDTRSSHPFQGFREMLYKTVVLETGDVYARAYLRKLEFDLSISVIREMLGKIQDDQVRSKPDYNMKSEPGMLCVSLTEGWRGEICHVGITDRDGRLMRYKIKDPSLHNWYMLALAVRNQEISDFPVCNKSFNLSYCGNDL